MESKLKTIQTICKVFRVLSIIVFICSIIGCVLAGIGGLSLRMIQDNDLIVSGVSVQSLIQAETGSSPETISVLCYIGAILCASEIVISKMTMNYFKKELADETPFTLSGAKQLSKLGLYTIIVSLISIIGSSIIASVALKGTNLESYEFSNGSSLFLGFIFILFGIVFQYGAEITNKK